MEDDEDEEKMFGEEEMDEINKKNAALSELDGEAEPTGKIVGIIRKKWRP